MGKQKEEEEKKDRAAFFLAERKKIIYNLVLLFAAAFVVLIGILTMAWFANNTKSNGTNMNVTVEASDYIQISLGKKNYYDEEPEENDWATQIDVSDFYEFGELIPASSTDGTHILFTPDSIGDGRDLAGGYRFYVADSKTDGDIKLHYLHNDNVGVDSPFNPSTDSDSLMAKVHVKDDNTNWRTESTAWYDTNDDGYYVDIPLWFRTNMKNGKDYSGSSFIPLKVEGTIEADASAGDLHKAVRVAILDENKTAMITDQSILPLKASNSVILDSYNYTKRDSDESNDEYLYGRKISNETGWISEKPIEPTSGYTSYTQYNDTDITKPIVKIPAAQGTTAGRVKVYLRIWIDGEDGDCYNATAGQDWKIHLKFTMMDWSND